MTMGAVKAIFYHQPLKWICICTFSILFWMGYNSTYRIWT